ncbi:MAG: hypothetical protein C5B48_05535, partial [Candidatus Rokuibacteriota bacterium]
VNIVDGVNYDFLRSFIATLKQTFPDVKLMVTPGGIQGQQNTFVVAASMQKLPRTRDTASDVLLTSFLNQHDATILTDDHVPVDQLLAPVFRKRMHQHISNASAGG